jgi:hypothetical protein
VFACAADRCRMPLVAALAVTVAVSRGLSSDSRNSWATSRVIAQRAPRDMCKYWHAQAWWRLTLAIDAGARPSATSASSLLLPNRGADDPRQRERR